ncbi:MAG: hypothetical protein ACFFDL_05470 [Promethearchaeota archaeon]
MKILCYFVIIIAFMMYFQKEPIYTVVIIGIGIGLYIYFKSRKGKSGVFGKFLGGNSEDSDDRMNDLILFFMLQQMATNSSQQHESTKQREKDKKQDQIDKIKHEVLDLLESD